jgi:hypothetical protein
VIGIQWDANSPPGSFSISLPEDVAPFTLVLALIETFVKDLGAVVDEVDVLPDGGSSFTLSIPIPAQAGRRL